MSWIQGNLQNSLDTWNNKMQEIWQLVIETTGIGNNTQMTLPQEIIDAINKVGFFDNIPLRCSNFNRKSVHNSHMIRIN